MQPDRRGALGWRRGAPLALLLLLCWTSAPRAAPLAARAPQLEEAMSWLTVELTERQSLAELAPVSPDGTFWDLRPREDRGRMVRWTVIDPVDAGLARRAAEHDADRALCAADEGVGDRLGCRLFRSEDAARAVWSDAPGDLPGAREWANHAEAAVTLRTGDRRAESVKIDGVAYRRELRAVAEGVALLPAGPREVVLVRELLRASEMTVMRYRFLGTAGRDVAVLDGVPQDDGTVRLTRAELLVSESGATRANDGMTIPYRSLSDALEPGTTGFLQYSTVDDTPLSSLVAGWSDVVSMISIDPTGVAYQPDPSDPSSLTVLPEVWDFSGLETANLGYRVFNTTRDDTFGNGCLETCAARDTGPTPPDGTWQALLKIDNWAPDGTLYTQDIFTLNDNDTGANPSIDVPYVTQDLLNVGDRTQICFEESAGGDWRFLRFFRFRGPDPDNAFMGVGDRWSSGDWTRCTSASGLEVRLASVCGDECYPGCSGSIATPRARGLLTPVTGQPDPADNEPADNQPGLKATILEDGFVHVPTGNFVPALLMRQDTDIEAGAELFGVCNLSPTRQRSFDYFWIQERYGLLALVSAPSDDTGTLPPDDWSQFGNITDGADFTWGPYPPYQMRADACLSGTRIGWSLPADGSNLGETNCSVTLPDTSTVPCVQDYGYVVAWGDEEDPELLADWDVTSTHSPLPGAAGYLAAPAGAEPAAFVIDNWPGEALNATVVTALTYVDPDAMDSVSYRSAAFYKVREDPARLDAGSFVVGDGVAPFVARSGADLELAWPAVSGASGYALRVFDLDSGAEIPCPAGLDCAPASPAATHVDGAAAGNLGYRAYAVDPCGESSVD